MDHNETINNASWKNFDWPSLGLATILIGLGVFFQLSASAELVLHTGINAYNPFSTYLLHVFIGISLAIASFYYYHPAVKQHATTLIVIAFILLVITNVFGFQINGSRRWLDMGFYQIRSFPFVLLLAAIYFCTLFSKDAKKVALFSATTCQCLLVFSGLSALLAFQANHNAILVLGAVLIAILLAARQFKLATVFLMSTTLLGLTITILSSYRTHVLRTMLISDRWDWGFQLSQSLTALAGGGLWGVGFQEGIIKGELPSAHEGFVLAVVSEELGGLTVFLVLLVSLVLFVRNIFLASRLKQADQGFEALLVSSFSSIFILFCLANIAVISGAFPTANIPYPFISYGFAFWVFFAICMGMIMRIDSDLRHKTSTSAEYNPVTTPSETKTPWISIGLVLGIATLLSYNFFTKAVLDKAMSAHYLKRAEHAHKMQMFSLTNESRIEKRGKILDRHGRILASNIEKADIIVNPSIVDLTDPKMKALMRLLGLSDHLLKVIESKRRNSHTYFVLKRNVDVETAKLAKDTYIYGVSIIPVSRRHYPHGEINIPLLGLTDIDNKGLSGIEIAFDEQLTVKDNVSLSIDSALQTLSYRHLEQSVIANGAAAGAIVIANSDTGEVLTMVSYPALHPDNRETINPMELKNRGITNLYEPRALFYPFVAVVGDNVLDYGPLERTVDTSPGYIEYKVSSFDGERTEVIRDTEDFGVLSATDVLQTKSRIGLIRLLESTPISTLDSFLTYFGFTVKTNLGLPEELNKTFPDIEEMSRYQRSEFAQGKGFLVTPVQLLQAYLPVANEGRMNQLSILKTPPNQHSYSTSLTPGSANALKTAMVIEDKGLEGLTLYGISADVPHFSPDGYIYHPLPSNIFVGMTTLRQTNVVIMAIIDKPVDIEKDALISQALAVSVLEEALNDVN